MLRRLSFAGLAAVLVVFLPACDAVAQENAAQPSRGFSPGSRSAELEAEVHALSVPNAAQARALLRTLTEEPHIAGTPADHKTAIFVRDKLREWGWKAEIEEYEVLLNYPSDEPTLELVRPSSRRLPVREKPIAQDQDSASRAASPAFYGYGISGNVAGQVVYVNYARVEDFKSLEAMGIDVKGKIVLARYGELFRGLKVYNAQKRGAAGILIYSDPAEDGYAKGDVYPAGPFRSESAIQRGSVQFLSHGPGDPSTPFGPSSKGAKRLPFDQTNGFPTERSSLVPEWEKQTGLKRNEYFANIPALPISYEAARPILEAIAGPSVPTGWQGGLPFAYHVGPGPAEVKFSTVTEYAVRPVWNVIAEIKGSVEPERWVMISNHRDAWVYGAVDPSSGTAATLESCRAIGSAVKKGWKPRRTLKYASWDAEEYGLVGSTEWAEDHAKEIDEKAVLMLNVDSAVGGPEIDADGIPSLRDWVLDGMAAITDLRSGKTLRQTWLDKRRTAWASSVPINLSDASPVAPEAELKTLRFSPRLNSLGSGSDYTAFVDHLGVPAVDVDFGGRYGVYHSIYDDFHWMDKFGDPEFLTHVLSARLYTVLAMRAAAAEVVPFTFVPYAEVLREEVDDLRRALIRKAAAADPDRAKPPLVFRGLESLIEAIKGFQSQAESVDRATATLGGRDGVPQEQLARVNDALKRVERAFLLAKGLPGRPWFKHAIYAPGLTTGYAAWTLPGIRRPILEDDAETLEAQVPVLVERIDAATKALKDVVEQAEAK